MASKKKPVCKYGAKCYRKNPDHLRDYYHPDEQKDEEKIKPKKTRSTDKTSEPPAKKTKKTIDDFFGGKKTEKSEEEVEKKKEEKEKDDSPDSDTEETSTSVQPEVSDEDIEEESDTPPPPSPDDVAENIKRKFLVEMPEDFYEFWEFCKSENSKNPNGKYTFTKRNNSKFLSPFTFNFVSRVSNVLFFLDLQQKYMGVKRPYHILAVLEDLGFKLVGPFDILAGKHKGVTKNSKGRQPNYLLHWRYYYDPPEFLTVIKGDDRKQFHLGYFRDDPAEMPAFVGSNAAADSCVIMPKGDNLFGAVKNCIDDRLKAKDLEKTKKSNLEKIQNAITDWAKKKNYPLETKTKKMKDRDKKVVCKSFHNAGIVVPVDANEVGYREVPETPESKTDSERNKNMEPLEELVTLVQFANDECDYGEGLELGMDLFCYGGKVFHSMISHLLPLAYQFLGRHEYAQIIEAHLKRRQHDADLNVIMKY
ncbi:hypothetical protein KUTeg_024830 [Tegillarca granosa]|uniref:PBZ-type domain-containing protein n=1 Tax=Tegillarca granosa TaxID=220873 RepID=A0ABQ9DZ02_TEGGR|nr:hypothetical protein KUTeg_024830 [Tegillarca granosa]